MGSFCRMGFFTLLFQVTIFLRFKIFKLDYKEFAKLRALRTFVPRFLRALITRRYVYEGFLKVAIES